MIFHTIIDSRCELYQGIPSFDDEKTCCHKDCVLCGGSWTAVCYFTSFKGAKRGCCAKDIPKDRICGISGTIAPCFLDGGIQVIWAIKIFIV